MKRTSDVKNRIHALRIVLLLCMLLFSAAASFGAVSAEESETKTVRVGYYENEVFEEGAQDGTVAGK